MQRPRRYALSDQNVSRFPSSTGEFRIAFLDLVLVLVFVLGRRRCRDQCGVYDRPFPRHQALRCKVGVNRLEHLTRQSIVSSVFKVGENFLRDHLCSDELAVMVSGLDTGWNWFRTKKSAPPKRLLQQTSITSEATNYPGSRHAGSANFNC